MLSAVARVLVSVGVASLACATAWGGQHAVVSESAKQSDADRPSVTLEGTVVDASGAPLDVFTLTTYQRGEAQQVHSFKGAGGRLGIGLVGRIGGLALDAPGHARWFHGVALRSAGTYDVGTVSLQRGRAVSGRLTDAGTGLPIADASISYAPTQLQVLNISVEDEYPLGWWATTDANGGFALNRLPERRVRLEVASAEHVTEAVRLPAGIDRLDIELGGSATIEGRLLLVDRTAVEGTVRLRFDHGRSGVLERRTDLDGRFRFEGLAADSYRLHVRTAAGVVDGRSVTVAKEEVATIEFPVEPLGRLSGRVSGLGESASASISVHSYDERWSLIHEGEAFGNGRFDLRGIPDGVHVAEGVAREGVGSRRILRKFKMVAGEATVDFDFNAAGRSRIAGRVVAGPRPVPRTHVYAVRKDDPLLRTAMDMSDRQGRYEIRGLEDGEYELRAWLGLRGTERAFDVTVAGDTTYDIRLGRYALSGAVIRPEGPQSDLANFVVQARLNSPSAELVIFRDFTDSRGAYRFDGLEDGSYTVSFAWPYYGAAREVDVVGASVENVDLRATPSETRDVRAVDADSEELLSSLLCKIEDGVWQGGTLDFEHRDGLPISLTDAHLTCWVGGYQAVRFRWDGEPLEINLSRESP